MAILFAFRSPALDVVGITTVFGNVTIENATRNALTLVDLVGASVPVARGAEHPLVKSRRPPPTFVHGADGLGSALLTRRILRRGSTPRLELDLLAAIGPRAPPPASS